MIREPDENSHCLLVPLSHDEAKKQQSTTAVVPTSIFHTLGSDLRLSGCSCFGTHHCVHSGACR
jgi:hypothetical protein